MNGMDVVYQYDGTLEGFLCCVYDSYVYKESPVGFSSDERSEDHTSELQSL